MKTKSEIFAAQGISVEVPALWTSRDGETIVALSGKVDITPEGEQYLTIIGNSTPESEYEIQNKEYGVIPMRPHDVATLWATIGVVITFS